MIPLKDLNQRRTFPIVTVSLIAVNVAVFLYQITLPPQAMTEFVMAYAMVPAKLDQALAGPAGVPLQAALLPFLTSMFLHGGWLHIIGNMWFLWIFGDNIEDQLGHFQYLVFYLLCGFAAALAHIVLNAGSNLPTVGASGAISGVMGAYLLLFPRAKVLTLVVLIVFFTFWWLPAWVFLLYWFALQILSGAQTVGHVGQETGGVAVWAHVGGFVAGLILIKVLPQRARRQRYASW